MFRHFLGHSGTLFAAEAMECAADQSGNAFWQFHDEYMNNSAMRASRDRAAAFAEDIGLDTDLFQECMDNHTHRDRINRDFQQARQLGVRLTPTIFVNDERSGTVLAAIRRDVVAATP